VPVYIYRRDDGTEFELYQKFSEDALTVCPITQQKVKRIIRSANFILRGQGFYKTDHAPMATAVSGA
jgi:putative FmdB family regulatory protein